MANNLLPQAATDVPTRRALLEEELGCSVEPKEVFLHSLSSALDRQEGFAAGKLGPSQQHWMIFPVLLDGASDRIGIHLFERNLRHHGLKNAGIFPATPAFYLRYNEFYLEHVRNLDSVGVFVNPGAIERVVVRHYGLKHLIHYRDQEPDRSVPDNPTACYLPFFEGKRLLIICPFARLLQQRATRETFEATWAKTGKRWFNPASVDAVEFPYGFSPPTQAAYGDAFSLFEEILRSVERREFDVALIAAAGLAIPLASSIKRMGKVAIDLGGHLQVLFGVTGQRWREREEWRSTYFNEDWIDMPETYKPDERDVCDNGAYW